MAEQPAQKWVTPKVASEFFKTLFKIDIHATALSNQMHRKVLGARLIGKELRFDLHTLRQVAEEVHEMRVTHLLESEIIEEMRRLNSKLSEETLRNRYKPIRIGPFRLYQRKDADEILAKYSNAKIQEIITKLDSKGKLTASFIGDVWHEALVATNYAHMINEDAFFRRLSNIPLEEIQKTYRGLQLIAESGKKTTPEAQEASRRATIFRLYLENKGLIAIPKFEPPHKADFTAERKVHRDKKKRGREDS